MVDVGAALSIESDVIAILRTIIDCLRQGRPRYVIPAPHGAISERYQQLALRAFRSGGLARRGQGPVNVN